MPNRPEADVILATVRGYVCAELVQERNELLKAQRDGEHDRVQWLADNYRKHVEKTMLEWIRVVDSNLPDVIRSAGQALEDSKEQSHVNELYAGDKITSRDVHERVDPILRAVIMHERAIDLVCGADGKAHGLQLLKGGTPGADTRRRRQLPPDES